jgi:hypothetical protein
MVITITVRVQLETLPETDQKGGGSEVSSRRGEGNEQDSGMVDMSSQERQAVQAQDHHTEQAS